MGRTCAKAAQKVSKEKDHARAYLPSTTELKSRRLFISTHQRGQNEPSGPPWPWLHLHFSLHPSVTYGKCAVERWYLLMQRTYFDALRRSPTHEGLGHDDRKWASSARGRQLRLNRSPQSPFCCGTDEARTVSSGLHWWGSSQGGCMASGIGANAGVLVRSPSDAEGGHAKGLRHLW